MTVTRMAVDPYCDQANLRPQPANASRGDAICAESRPDATILEAAGTRLCGTGARRLWPSDAIKGPQGCRLMHG
jgi:hypothetical protein